MKVRHALGLAIAGSISLGVIGLAGYAIWRDPMLGVTLLGCLALVGLLSWCFHDVE